MQFSDVIELGNSSRTEDVRSSGVSFQSLMISAGVISRMVNHGFKYPSPVQEKAIPAALSGLDILVQAKSGTGKTLVFSVMAVENLNTRMPHPQRLILAPTREIAGQIRDTVKKIAVPGTRITVLVGGTPLSLDKANLQKGTHVVIGTTGRICQLINEGVLSLQHVESFVLDEADKLMDESFHKDINFIFSCLPSSRQVAVFSATYPRGLDDTLGKYMRDATLIRLNSDDVQLVGIKQYVSICFGSTAVESAVKIFTNVTFNQALVFCNSHAECEPTCCRFTVEGFQAAFISSQMAQSERDKVIESLKHNKIKILVSTDLTARGIDASNVNLVVNIGSAINAETYFHRIGRAARFGGQGAAVTLLEDGKAIGTFSYIAKAGGITAKNLNLAKIPADLTTNAEFHTECQPFSINKKKKDNGEATTVRKIKEVSSIPQVVPVKIFEFAVAMPEAENYTYNRKEMNELSKYLPQISNEFLKRIADLEVGNPDFAAEAEALLAQIKDSSVEKKNQVESSQPAKAGVKFKFVSSREKAKKKFYLRGEMLTVRDGIPTDSWLHYAQSKFNLEEEPFVLQQQKQPKQPVLTVPESGESAAAPITPSDNNKVTSNTTSASPSVEDVSFSDSTDGCRRRRPDHSYTRTQMLGVTKSVTPQAWLAYVKQNWDTSEEPWQLDPQLRCPVADQLRRIRERERQERFKVAAERQKAAELEPKLNASSRFLQRQKMEAKSFPDWCSKVRAEFEEFKENPPTRKGPVVPVRDGPKSWQERVRFYSGWVENFERRFANATRISEGAIKEQAINTEEEVVILPKQEILPEEATSSVENGLVEETKPVAKEEKEEPSSPFQEKPFRLQVCKDEDEEEEAEAVSEGEEAMPVPLSPKGFPPIPPFPPRTAPFSLAYDRYFTLLRDYCHK